MSASIFISFASQDHRVAMTLCQALETRGFKCWISSRDIEPGENFQVAIVRAIRQAKIMLLVFTANSNNSEEMNKELALASQSKLIVVPLRIEDVTPNEAFAYEFATRQWIDFFADWEVAIQQLSQRIENATRDVVVEAPARIAASPEPVAPEALAEEAAVEKAGPVSALTRKLKVARPLPDKAAPKPAPRAAAEPASFEEAKAAIERDAAMDADADALAAPRRRRAAMYVGISLVVLIVAGIGLAAPGLLRPKDHPESRAMVALLPTAAPSSLQKALDSAAAPGTLDPAAATATDPAAADAADAPKAPVKKKKAKVVQPADDVPY